MMSSMPDLFDDGASAWRCDPQKAFEAFVVSPDFLAMSKRRPNRENAEAPPSAAKPLRKSSALVYIAMWSRFLRWLASTSRPSIFDVCSDDLMAFLEQRSNGKRVLEGATIRRQYLTLFDRVYRHLNVHPNPAIHACFAIFKNRSTLVGNNAPKAMLSDAQQVAFMRALPQA
jgi:hypothetical protein